METKPKKPTTENFVPQSPYTLLTRFVLSPVDDDSSKLNGAPSLPNNFVAQTLRTDP